MDGVDIDYIIHLLGQGFTYKHISEVLQNLFPGKRGFSMESIKKYCKKHGLSSRISQGSLERMISEAVDEVGPTYGRKMMKGYLQQKHGISFGDKRVGRALSAVAPGNHQRRKTLTASAINPIPYRADYFGHKLHVDQNEKLVMYGVTHVAAIDGHSRYVVAAATMPIKNNVIIYNDIYKHTCTTFGMFHQLRVDCGREFFLMLGMQEMFKNLRNRHDIAEYRQTQSKMNLPIERFWCEVNSRVNYPIKIALVEMDNDGQIDMSNEVHKFCVSRLSIQVANFGLQTFVRSWNEHPIPGRGVPSVIKARTNRIDAILTTNLPDGNVAKDLYERTYRGRITAESRFGNDPLEDFEYFKIQRDVQFQQKYHVPMLFQACVNETPKIFKEAILYFINLSMMLSPR